MRSKTLATITLLIAVFPALAQQAPKQKPSPFPTDWTIQHDQIQRMLKFAAGNLELDEQQRLQFEDISQEQGRQFKETQSLFARMDEAIQGEDKDEITRISEQIESLDSPWGTFLNTTDGLDQLLSPPQRQVFDELTNDTQWLTDHESELARLREQLPSSLKLDASQQKELQRMLDRQQMLLNNRAAEMRALCHDIYEALLSNDEQANQEFRQTLGQLRQNLPNPGQAILDNLGTVLRDEQKPLLSGFATEFHSAKDKTKSSVDGVRFVLVALRKISIKPSQKSKINAIRRDAIRELDRLQRKGVSDDDDLSATLQQKLRSVLSRKQMQQLEVSLKATREHAKKMRLPNSTVSPHN